MKNLMFLFLIALTITACGNDDDNNDDNTQDLLIGTWLQTGLIFDGEDVTEPGDCPFSLTFTANMVTENEFFGDDCAMLDTFTDPYTLDGDTIELTTDIGVFTIEIETITQNNLRLDFTDPDTNDVSTGIFVRQ